MTRFLRRVSSVVLASALPISSAVASASIPTAPAEQRLVFRPGAAGAGDPYFPQDGNGGYDVRRYLLDLRYDPSANHLSGTATITATATQDLSRFNLDLDGLTVSSVSVDGRPAAWRRRSGELTIDPQGRGLREGRGFRVAITYRGKPQLGKAGAVGAVGVFHRGSAAVAVGQPHVASFWFPANDHPTDKAAYEFRIAAPTGRQVLANGALVGREAAGEWTTWTWRAQEPMASYLATFAVGNFDLRAYRRGQISYWDAIDTRLLRPVATPRTGQQFAVSRIANTSYKRLTRRVRVPTAGATLTFWTKYDLEPEWDFLFVEARPVGTNRWTTLPDTRKHTSTSTGSACPGWHAVHPFLKHYQRAKRDGTCAARGSTGRWHAATGRSKGYEQWVVDLDRYAGRTVEVSITHASDDIFQLYGAVIDDIVVSTGQGSTSFEADAATMDGWRVPGPPRGTRKNRNDWVAGGTDRTPEPAGEVARKAFARQPEIIRFLSSYFGPYPYDQAGGIIVADRRIQFALENQTRPVYGPLMLTDITLGLPIVVHEIAHQWYGNKRSLRRWRDIWLNEGFTTYAEWLWSAEQGGPTPADTFRAIYRNTPRNDPFWKLRIGDPGPDRLFDAAVYIRGGMTLHALRVRVGDEAFFAIIRRWADGRPGGMATTGRFIRLAERVSGKQLDQLFRTWLFTPTKPEAPWPTKDTRAD